MQRGVHSVLVCRPQRTSPQDRAGTPAPETVGCEIVKDVLRSTGSSLDFNTSLCEQPQQESKMGNYTEHCPSLGFLICQGYSPLMQIRNRWFFVTLYVFCHKDSQKLTAGKKRMLKWLSAIWCPKQFGRELTIRQLNLADPTREYCMQV